jgi:hypothetical protein
MKRVVILAFLIALGIQASSADDDKVGRLKGVVRDSEKNEAIVGATIMLSNTKLGTRADEVGRFELSSIPAGVYEVKISAVGYKPRFRQVEIRAGQVATLDIHLVATGVSGEEVVVSATRYAMNKIWWNCPLQPAWCRHRKLRRKPFRRSTACLKQFRALMSRAPAAWAHRTCKFAAHKASPAADSAPAS